MLDFFVSSDSIPTTSNFMGYAFQGTDLIIGSEGYAEYIASGGPVFDDCDGCYLKISMDNTGNLVFSTDFHGYFPLFYYIHDEHWIVSPSFEIIAREAHLRGWPLTLRQHQFVSWSSSLALFQSPSSDRTPFDEVRLLSYDAELITEQKKLSVRAKIRTLKSTSYCEALSDLIATWGGRIMTILKGGMAIRADLSGGVDSRTVLAVLYWTLEKEGALGLFNSDSIFINSNSSMIEDYNVAKAIGNKFNITINNSKRRKYINVSDEEAFTTWKQYNIARYSPHLLPMVSQESHIITFNGVGGEDHRAFYDGFGRGPFGEYLVSLMHCLPSQERFGKWMGDIYEDVDLPASVYDNAVPASIRHYRRHRSRHHTSKQPVSEFMGVILGGRHSYECARHLDVTRLEDNQLLFDIMINCNEELARMQYDQPYKAPKQKNFDNFTRVNIEKPALAGKIWRGVTNSSVPVADIKGRNIPLRKAVEEVLARPEIRSLIGEEVASKAEAQLTKLTPNNNLHSNGHLFHYVLLADVVLRYRTS